MEGVGKGSTDITADFRVYRKVGTCPSQASMRFHTGKHQTCTITSHTLKSVNSKIFNNFHMCPSNYFLCTKMEKCGFYIILLWP